MKKLISFLFIFLVLFTLAACTKTYQVTFTSKDVLIDTQEVIDGELASEVTPEAITGEDFVGWFNGEEKFDFSTPVTSDLNLVAKWETTKYTITFKNDDGTVLQETEVAHNEAIVAPAAPTKASDANYDYTFDKWDVEFDKATEDLVITAVFKSTLKKYTVTFYNEDNTVNAEIQVEKGSQAGKITLTKEDDALYSYSFDAWYTEDGTRFSFSTPITSDIKLYPRFDATPKDFDIKGKTVSILGDSISSFYSANSSLNSYYTGTNEFYYPTYSSTVKTAENTWWGMALKSFGAKLGVNNSLSGSLLCGSSNQAGVSDARIDTLDENGTPDVIIVFLGTNDNASGISAQEFKTTYATLLQKLHKAYPNAYVFCFNNGYSNYHINLPDSHGKYSEETRVAYNEAIEEVCKANNAAVIDLASIQTVDTYNQMLGDNLHPSYEGMRKISSLVFSTVTDYFNQGKEMFFISYVTDEQTNLVGDSLEFFYEGTTATLPTAEKAGYDFLGWYLSEDFEGDPITTTEGFNDNVELYPWFEASLAEGEYRVIFKANGGNVGETDREVLMNKFLVDFSAYLGKEVTSIETWGCTATLVDTDPNEPNKVSYTITFDQPMSEWKQQSIYDMLKDSEYAANWRWLVDYVQACAVNNRAHVSYSETNPWPEPLMIELYAFFKGAQISWTGVHSTADYSQPEILEETVKFTDYACIKAKAFAGTVAAADLPTPVKEGATFAGWYTNPEFTGEAVTEITEACTLYAKWQ